MDFQLMTVEVGNVAPFAEQAIVDEFICGRHKRELAAQVGFELPLKRLHKIVETRRLFDCLEAVVMPSKFSLKDFAVRVQGAGFVNRNEI